MSRLIWGDSTIGRYHSGLDRGVFYNQLGIGSVWDGLVSLVEISSEVSSHIHLDGHTLLNRKRFGTFQATIDAFTYPKALDAYRPPVFGLSYRVLTDGGYQIHLVYHATAVVKTPTFSSINRENQEALFSIDLHTMNALFSEGYRTSHLIVETDNLELLSSLEDILYGTDVEDARLPTPTELIEIFESHALIRVTDNHDGTFTISGPDELVYWVDDTKFEVISDGVTWLDSETYRIKST